MFGTRLFRLLARSKPGFWSRSVHSTSVNAGAAKRFNQPMDPNQIPRSGGIATMMRLPQHDSSDGLDVCFVGIPLDTGTSNRSGTRVGPRQIRTESCLIRLHNAVTGASPFESLVVGDVGDIGINTFNLPACVDLIREGVANIISGGCKPLILGGDHTITYPILQAIKNKYGPVGLVHVDAHSDTSEHMYGERVAHGTPFRRAVEEGLLDCNRVVQIGLRGSAYTANDYGWAHKQGFRVVGAHECWHKSLDPLMAEVREQMGSGPVYITFDIDALDPAFAPGTGTPEIGGLTTIQAMEIIRGCKGMNIVGGDVVEVSPPYDMSGTTALVAANLFFEMLCVLPGVKYAPKSLPPT